MDRQKDEKERKSDSLKVMEIDTTEKPNDIDGSDHGLINYKDTKPQMSSILVFIRDYRLEILFRP